MKLKITLLLFAGVFLAINNTANAEAYNLFYSDPDVVICERLYNNLPYRQVFPIGNSSTWINNSDKGNYCDLYDPKYPETTKSLIGQMAPCLVPFDYSPAPVSDLRFVSQGCLKEVMYRYDKKTGYSNVRGFWTAGTSKNFVRLIRDSSGKITQTFLTDTATSTQKRPVVCNGIWWLDYYAEPWAQP